MPAKIITWPAFQPVIDNILTIYRPVLLFMSISKYCESLQPYHVRQMHWSGVIRNVISVSLNHPYQIRQSWSKPVLWRIFPLPVPVDRNTTPTALPPDCTSSQGYLELPESSGWCHRNRSARSQFFTSRAGKQSNSLCFYSEEQVRAGIWITCSDKQQ